MKKVMVLTVVFMLLATSAFAVIRNSKHDLSTGNASGATIVSTNYDETCVFCHTPHGGQTGMLAPLWNRSHLGDAYDATTVYNSATLEVDSAPGTVFPVINRSDARLCMSCHDGTTLVGGLLNQANSVPAPPAFTNTTVGTDADLGASLVDDHPIGMDYVKVQASDDSGNALYTVTGSSPNMTVGTDLPLYYDSTLGADVMWCSSCHDVHDDTFSPFLNMDNTGSALCTTCHKK